MWSRGATFDEVAVYFSAEEWATLEKWQKELYKEVVVEQYQTLLSVGLMKVIPEIILRIMMGEEPVVNHKRAACETPAPETSSARPQGNIISRPQGNIIIRLQSNTISRPQGNIISRPQGNIISRPQGNIIIRLQSNTISRPQGITITSPQSNTITSPQSNTITSPQSNTITSPQSNTITRPGGTTITRPGGTTITRPEGTTITRPEGTTITRPEGTTITRPEGTTITRPEGTTITRPEGTTITRPEGTTITRPEGTTITRPQGNTITRPQGNTIRILEDSWNNTSNTKMNLRHKKLNIPTEIYPISARQKEKTTHKKGEIYKNFLENHSDPDEGLMPAIEKQTRVKNHHVCVDCGKTFTLRSSLITHTTANSCIRKHSRSDCGASVNYQSQLLIHQKTHIGSKFHKCSTCGKCFVRKSSLEVHIRSHTGEKPFICSLCNKNFNEAGNLRRHVRIHTGERPFRCDCCGKCFNDASVLIRHGKWYCPLKKGKSRKLVREEPRNGALDAESQSKPSITCVEGGQVCSSLLTLEAEVMESGQGDPQVVGDARLSLTEELNSVGVTYQEIMKPLDTRDECDREVHPTVERGGGKDWTPVTNSYVKGIVNDMCKSYVILIVPPASSSDIHTQNTRTLSQENMVQDMDNRVNSNSDNHQNSTKFGLKNKRDQNIVLTSACSSHEGPPATNPNLVVHKSNADEQLYPINVKQEWEDGLLENTTCEIRLSAPPSGIKGEVDEWELTQQTTWSTQDVLKTKEDISRFTQNTTKESPRIICATTDLRWRSHLAAQPGQKSESLGNQKNVTKRSRKTVADIKQRTCSKCGESFTYDCRRLIPHRCQEKLFHCDCGESFKHGFQLEGHQKTHSSLKTYKCQKCRKAFKCEANLIQHLRSHTELRPYPCTECGKAFKEAGKLRRHLRIHTGEKPFCCAECGKRFNDSSSLNRHRKIHTAKAYQCSQCRRRFRDAPGLHRHIKTHRSR
ncbi:uncharacterized protein LOC122938202 [Bufo gargarizans]|uniref:uncharacterized protein LOC122938202 n=1 Tax=Bufo gargarizans TaxID=30331 RepID=UPI001CF5B895|nr:uncharacterized protein LOC122938202 [Bufo gargarizans]